MDVVDGPVRQKVALPAKRTITAWVIETFYLFMSAASNVASIFMVADGSKCKDCGHSNSHLTACKKMADELHACEHAVYVNHTQDRRYYDAPVLAGCSPCHLCRVMVNNSTADQYYHYNKKTHQAAIKRYLAEDRCPWPCGDAHNKISSCIHHQSHNLFRAAHYGHCAKLFESVSVRRKQIGEEMLNTVNPYLLKEGQLAYYGFACQNCTDHLFSTRGALLAPGLWALPDVPGPKCGLPFGTCENKGQNYIFVTAKDEYFIVRVDGSVLITLSDPAVDL